MRRAPWVTGLLPDCGSSQVWGWLSESGVMELPHTLYNGIIAYLSWYFHRKMLGFFWCERDYCIPSSIAKKYNVFFLSTPSISKGVTPMILRQFDSCIVHYRPRCHFKTFLESLCSVIFILNPIPVILSKIFFGFPGHPIPYFSKRDKWLLILVGGNPFNLYYNIRIKTYISQAFSLLLTFFS